ncbi:MAG: PKD domain-containing protein [Brumimicrobium sp.]
MKNNLENAFKDKLSNFEAPYDPQAWSSVKNQLDAKSTGGGGSSALKWIAATAIIATIAVTGYIILSQDKNTKTAEVSQKNETAPNKNIEQNANEKKAKTNNASENNVDFKEDDQNELSQSNSAITNEKVESESNEVSDNNNESLSESNDINASNPDKVESSDNIQNVSVLDKMKYIQGNVSSNEVCAGDKITIRNTGLKLDLVRFEYKNETITLKKAHSFDFSPETSTVINFVNDQNLIVETEYIKVNELPTPDFSYETDIYEKGVPVTKCNSYGDYQELKWTFDKDITKSGEEVTHNFFEKGTHDITLEVIDFNGCKNALTKKVRVEEKYNLLAVDAFKPNDNDIRNNTFMPYSLTQRDVRFTLTIVDPRDNGVVFASDDATNSWDGTDERSGKMTPAETVYIWKVQIENPLPNERPVYAGTVVHN